MCNGFGSCLSSAETKETSQPQDGHWLRVADKGRRNWPWPCQTSCEMTSLVRDTLTHRIVPPGTDGKSRPNATDLKNYLMNLIEGILGYVFEILEFMIFCFMIYVCRKILW